MSCIRLQSAQTVFMQDMSLFDALVALLQATREPEVAANGLKTVRLLLK